MSKILDFVAAKTLKCPAYTWFLATVYGTEGSVLLFGIRGTPSITAQSSS